jgi:hypothetical protein
MSVAAEKKATAKPSVQTLPSLENLLELVTSVKAKVIEQQNVSLLMILHHGLN